MNGVKTMLGVLGALLLFFGGIWILQGLNVSWAPQSFMTSDINWTYRGAGFAVAGLVMLAWSLRGGAWRDVLGGLGALLAVVGGVIVLEAINVLGGMSFSGHPQWVPRGAIIFVIGAALIFVATRRGKSAA